MVGNRVSEGRAMGNRVADRGAWGVDSMVDKVGSVVAG